ncbi:MAG: hypothetical protein LBC79_03060 [Deltaproteobacteria bacterium]|jgi:hypothetical protein|nr:hypothetical protein [Deltaproteobacteria bacterium]
MKMRFPLLLMSALLMFSLGCSFRSTSQVAAPAGGSGMSASQEGFTAKDMRAAIFNGCAEKNWRAIDVDANTIEATIVVRNKHTVVVSIPYTAASYSINYKSSTNMAYKSRSDGTFSINRSYNNWVRNLDEAIQRQVARKQTVK